MDWVSGDGKKILLSRGLRSFGYGFISVILAIYLSELGFGSAAIGLLVGATIIGGALFTVFTGKYAASYGIRKMLLFSLLASLAGITVFLFSDSFVPLLFACFIGFLSPSGNELGPFLSLEQAYLPSTVSPADRTMIFSYWNIVAALTSTFGALFGSLPLLLQKIGFEKIMSFRAIFALYLALNLIAFLVYASLSEARPSGKNAKLTENSKRIVTKLSLLFSVDSLGGGLIVTSVVSLWFYTRFGATLDMIAAMFFVAGVVETFSYYISTAISRRIGLVNTMVFTHLPSSIMLIAIPFMPSFYLAAALYVLRQFLSEMDIPPRQSYIAAVVKPDEQAVAASTTNVAKITASSIGAAAAGALLAGPFSPFILSGVLKSSYDIALYLNFKKIKPSEEK